jgi:hypothetical protein
MRHHKMTHNCPHPRSYSQKHDAYYCEKCDKWLEGNCRDPECEFCRDRPERPSECESRSS